MDLEGTPEGLLWAHRVHLGIHEGPLVHIIVPGYQTSPPSARVATLSVMQKIKLQNKTSLKLFLKFP